MNILITGSNGFIGRNLSSQLSNRFNHTVVKLNRSNCDLLNPDSVTDFFERTNLSYNLVIHTAIEGGRRNKPDTLDIVYKNILMLYNLLANQKYFQSIISFGSGAELDRRYDINQNSVNRYPVDPYGLSKSVIHKICCDEPKLCNFRIFNCFGIDEAPDRMIRSNIIKYLNKEDMIIHQNRKMDFFYIDDLVTIIHNHLENHNIPKYLDCCYNDKYTLLDIANIINGLDEHKVGITTAENNQQINPINSMQKDYIGIPIQHTNLIGLEKALKIIYTHHKESINE